MKNGKRISFFAVLLLGVSLTSCGVKTNKSLYGNSAPNGGDFDNGFLFNNSATKASSKGNASSSENILSSSEDFKPEIEAFNPITPDIENICENYNYSFSPYDFFLKEQEEWDYSNSELKALDASTLNRPGHFLVYCFEGSYIEGYQGDYFETYGYLYLWDDGLFNGTVNSVNIKGFWYNSSLDKGHDASGMSIKDCLNMVSQTSKYESIITSPSSGFYDRMAYVYLGLNWGTRSMLLNGYYYYPEVALAIDTSGTGVRFKVGDTFDISAWTVNRILKNKKYSPVFNSEEVVWTYENGMLTDNTLTKNGIYDVTASWNGLSTSVSVIVRKN